MRKNKQTEFVSVMGLNDEEKVVLNGEKKEKEEKARFSFKPLGEACKKNWKKTVAITAVLVVFLGVFIGGGFYFEHKYQQQLQEEYAKQAKEGLTYFASEATEPEKSAEQLTSLVTQAYYTNDGSLAVQFCFANGMEKAQRLYSVKVTIKNDEDAVIAEGYTDAISDDYVIQAGGTKTLLLYMLPEHVKIANDALDTISYDITTEYEEVE